MQGKVVCSRVNTIRYCRKLLHVKTCTCIKAQFHLQNSPPPVARRDRIVVSTLRCGRSNPGSNPGHGRDKSLPRHRSVLFFFFSLEASVYFMPSLFTNAKPDLRDKTYSFTKSIMISPAYPHFAITCDDMHVPRRSSNCKQNTFHDGLFFPQNLLVIGQREPRGLIVGCGSVARCFSNLIM